MSENWDIQRKRIIGLGENSFKKSYYPDLQEKLSELEDANLNLRALFDSTLDGIVIHNRDGKILYLNNQARKFFHIDEETPVKYTVYDISASGTDTSELLPIWNEVLAGHPRTIEWKIREVDNDKIINVEVSINRAVWYGEVVIVAVIRDFTERLRYEQELYHAKNKAEESDRLKTVFLNNMSHEIRTPMNGIMGFSDMLTSPGLTQEQQRNYIRIIQNSCRQLLRIIDDILEISNLETNQIRATREKVCLNHLLLDLFSIFNLKTKDGRISLYLKNSLPDTPGTVYTDQSRLQKIMSNLIENALKFTYEGFVEFGYKVEKDKLVLYVTDTGVGIAKEYHDKIFRRFSQEEIEISKNRGGLGLGLSIAKENAGLLGGEISLKSEKGKGSTFYVTLPYEPVYGVSKIKSGNEAENQEPVPEIRTILIAEDEEVNYLYLEALLQSDENLHCNILHAKNGKDAVELFIKHPETDCILMDLKMPMMHGYAAAAEIWKVKPGIPIIAQTAYSTSFDREKALEAGFYDFISKPIDKSHMFRTLYQVLKISPV